MPRRESYTVWNETVYGKDPDGPERGIQAPDDWRDPDRVLDLRGARVIELEQTTPGRRVVVQEANGAAHIDIIAWLEKQVGRVLETELVARDHQRHNI